MMRRRVSHVTGELELHDGGRIAIDAASLRAPSETALRLLAIAMPLLATGAVVARLS